VLNAIAATPDIGSGIASLSGLVGVVDAAITHFDATLAIIKSYTGSNTAPTSSDYSSIGITGVTAGNLAAINSFVAPASESATDSLGEVQGLVDAWIALQATADGNASSAASLTQAQFVTLGLQGISADAANLLNSVVSALPGQAVDTSSELSALYAQVQRVIDTAASNTLNQAPSLADLQALGLSGVTAANLAVIQQAIR